MLENLNEGESEGISLRAEIQALKTFFLYQIYVIKKNAEDSNNQEHKIKESHL